LIIGSAILTLTVLLGGQEPTNPSQSSSERIVLTGAQQRAKLELNEAAASYREGQFSEARRHVETAQEYDPQNKTARQFLARILHRQYQPGDQSPEKRSEAYVVLATKDWHCAIMVTDSPANKETEVRKNRAIIHYHKPKSEAEFQQAKSCVAKGLSEIEISINLSPENETAWSYKTNLLLEASKLAEMEGQLISELI
jgi:hypothetical protein